MRAWPAERISIVVAWIAPGNVYPVTRTPDYADPSNMASDSKLREGALQPRFNSHYAFVSCTHGYQCMDGVRHPGVEPDYDELVTETATQALPAYRLYFKVKDS